MSVGGTHPPAIVTVRHCLARCRLAKDWAAGVPSAATFATLDRRSTIKSVSCGGIFHDPSHDVVFSDKDIEILKKYGWVPVAAVGGGMMMSPPDARADNLPERAFAHNK